MVDKNFCMSSYLAFRYIEKDGYEFYDGLKHTGDMPYPEDRKVLVKNAEDVAKVLNLNRMWNWEFFFLVVWTLLVWQHL